MQAFLVPLSALNPSLFGLPRRHRRSMDNEEYTSYNEEEDGRSGNEDEGDVAEYDEDDDGYMEDEDIDLDDPENEALRDGMSKLGLSDRGAR